MYRILIASVCAAAALAQQPEMAHLMYAGSAGSLSLDFMAHDANCSAGQWGAQISTSPDFSAASWTPAYACDDFTAQEPGPTFAVRVRFDGLVPGTTYYYACGSEVLNAPFSEVFSFTYASGSVREGGAVYAVLADFGYYNAESLGRLIGDFEDGKFDALIHAGDTAYNLEDNKGKE
jgi:phosphodiesterase/alkaline phosphatase D-like protein